MGSGEQMVTEAKVREALRGVNDPEIGRPIEDIGMLQQIEVAGDLVRVHVLLTIEGCPLRDRITREVTAAVQPLPGVERVEVTLTPMSPEQRETLVGTLRGPTATGPSKIRFAPSTSIVAIASGKGGVGKSSVTVNLAAALAADGHKVGVLDADVWGFSVPRMLGAEGKPVGFNDMIMPLESYGVKVISMGFFVPEDTPVIWRGPMLHKALEQFLTDFYWGDPDYLVVDMPPGTGDISLSLAQFLPGAEAYVVTTPQPAAQRVAQRAGTMFQKPNIRIPVRGVIENMAWFTGNDGTRYQLFGEGGGELLAKRLDVPLIGRVPLVPELREGGDNGMPITVSEPESEAATAFSEIARLIEEHKPTKRRNPALKLA